MGWLALNKVDLYASLGNSGSWSDRATNTWSSWQLASTRDSGFLMVLGGRQLSSGLDDLVGSSQRQLIRLSGILKGLGIELYGISRWTWVKVDLVLGFSRVSRIENFASALDVTRDSGSRWYLADVGTAI